MKRFLSILTAVAMLASCAVVSFADEAENDIMLISEAPEADLVADSAADIVADSAADIEADSAADIEADSAADIVADSAADIVADSAADIEADSAADIEADSAADEAEVAYTDLSADDWAYESIVALTKAGVISGDADKKVRPADAVTRAELSKIVLGARGYEIDSAATLTATDADDVADWAKEYVATAMAKGIIKGYEDGSVRSGKVVTRAELAVVIVRAISATSEVEGNSFTDVSADAWYAKDVECAKTLGIVGGYEDGSFRGESTVTRREAFAMVSRMMNLLAALQQ